MPDWMKHKLESRLLGDINNLRHADDTNLMAKSQEELKSLLMKVKEESEKVGFKFSILVPSLYGKYKWEKMETVIDFIFLGSKITVDIDCSHEIKRYLLLERKVMTNLDSVLKSRDITFCQKRSI